MCDLCRRAFITGFAATGGATFLSRFAAAQPAPSSGTAALPSRDEVLIRGALVLTMDPVLGNVSGGAVHVRNGEIVAVGSDVEAPGAPILDGSGMILIPGLVETHWHMWNTLFRSLAGDKPSDGYFPTVARLGAKMTPSDIYESTRLSAAEAINNGMTFVHSWCHNVRSRDHAEADLRALKETGIRARHSCGWPQGLPDTEMADQSTIEGLARDWSAYANDGLLTLGMAWRGQFRAGPISEAVYRPEWENARRLGLPITVHVASARKAVGQIEPLAKAGLLGKDVQLIHTLSASAAELDTVKESGASVSVSPGSELRIGYGFPQVGEMLAKGIPVGVSVDTSALLGNSSLFPILKLLRDVENAKAESEFKMTARQALELGTLGGARSMGLEATIGSITPGKRADLVLINPNTLNMGSGDGDPAHLVLECTLPENVDTVMVDGRILKRGGKLVALDPAAVLRGARGALDRVRRAAAG